MDWPERSIGDHKKKDQEEKKIAIAEKSQEIQMLAVTGLDAFEAVGLSSEVPEVKKAIELCSSYTPLPTDKKTPETSSSVATLWKEQACSSNIEQDIDSRAVAVSVLGEKLVSAVTQERQQPPDVSTNIYVLVLLLVPSLHAA